MPLPPNTRRIRNAALIFAVFLLAIMASHARAADNETVPEGFPVFLHTDASFYLNNLEYFNQYQQGMTFFGAQASLYLTVDRPRWDFSLGVFLKREFGDEDGLSEVLPLFRFRYKTSYLKFIFGFIDSDNNHGLPEALLSLQYPFEYPIEEGAQLLGNYGAFAGDAWINWYLLNTPDYREFFASGLRVSASWPRVSCDLASRIAHHGGQIYDSGPLTNNIAGVARCTLSENWHALKADFGVSGSLYGSYVNEELVILDQTQAQLGYGGAVECFFAPYGWRLYYEAFFGNDFYAEQGNPLYRTDLPLQRFGVRKSIRWDVIRARFQAEGLIIESNLEYDYLLVIDVFLDFFLHRFGKTG